MTEEYDGWQLTRFQPNLVSFCLRPVRLSIKAPSGSFRRSSCFHLHPSHHLASTKYRLNSQVSTGGPCKFPHFVPVDSDSGRNSGNLLAVIGFFFFGGQANRTITNRSMWAMKKKKKNWMKTHKLTPWSHAPPAADRSHRSTGDRRTNHISSNVSPPTGSYFT